MLKTVDVGLMANHLSSHQGVIRRLELYTKLTKNQQLNQIFNQQIGAMKNHVQVMNMLLNPHQTNQQITVPPIPQNGMQMQQPQPTPADIDITDRDMALDAHFTATAMANDNFVSASSMKNIQVKHLHIEMAMQQFQLAEQHERLAEQMGWMTHPVATTTEQQQAISQMPPQGFQPYRQMANNGQMNGQNQQHRYN
ncbi:hypothetical protein [Bacillus suaedae]|uniref:Spore coat protein n=1 Tax=Halalkalibacter suaedae TaxID=2822140 RepID=A0A940X194_9BACI|nr:hypothetical protein [Bacillus suaedae]MBP3952884.1 hypothetical protein [Bacillus suaedae]